MNVIFLVIVRISLDEGEIDEGVGGGINFI